jgi:hypothetical protein
MKLNKDQIEQLKKLISHKGYLAVDVQYEILDHVACQIEELMEENSMLDLPTAFNQVHASFGVFGFSKLEESYLNLIEKRFKRYYWQEIKTLFTSQKIMIPIGIALAMYQTSLWVQDLKTWYLIMIAALLIPLGLMYVKYRKNHSRYKGYASYRAQNTFFVYLNIAIQICLQANFFMHRSEDFFESIGERVLLGLVVLGMAFLFLSFFFLPKVLDRNIADTETLIQMYGES